MSSILITPLAALEEAAKRHRPSHVLTLIDPETHVMTPESVLPGQHLRLGINDIVEHIEGHVVPQSDHVARILAFAAKWDRSQPFLVHCWAGISRSTAAAYTLMCDIHGPGHEDAIAKALRARAPHANPNRLMVKYADTLLGREGRMIAAVEAMGPSNNAWEGEVVELPLSLAEL